MTSCWNTILNALATRVDAFDFKVWLAPLVAQTGERSLTLCLQGASRYMLHRLEKKMGALIRAAAAQVFACAPEDVQLSFSATGALASVLAAAAETPKAMPQNKPAASQQRPAQAALKQAEQTGETAPAQEVAAQPAPQMQATAPQFRTPQAEARQDRVHKLQPADAAKPARSIRAGKRKPRALQEPSLLAATAAQMQETTPGTAAQSDRQSGGQPAAAGKSSRRAETTSQAASLAEILEKAARQARADEAASAAAAAAETAGEAAREASQSEQAPAQHKDADKPAAGTVRKRVVHGGVYKRHASSRLAAAARMAAEAAEAASAAATAKPAARKTAPTPEKPAVQPAATTAAAPVAQKAAPEQEKPAVQPAATATAAPAAQKAAPTPEKPAAQPAAAATAAPAAQKAAPAQEKPSTQSTGATVREAAVRAAAGSMYTNTAYTGPADGAFSMTTSSDVRPAMGTMYMGQAASDAGHNDWQAGGAFSQPVGMVPVSAISSDAGPGITVSDEGGTSSYTVRPQALVRSLPLDQAATLSGDALNRKQWRYTFADFVTGPSNAMAVSAAQDVCRPRSFVETLFVSSEPGLGKTHIVQSAVRQILEDRGPTARVAYLTAEDFYARFRMGLRNDSLDDFTGKVRALDFLLLDDVQYLCGKNRTQELLMSLVKQLQDKGSKVVFTSRFLSKDLKKLDSQLVSLIASGVQASMDAPDYAMRCEIVRRKARAHGILLDEEVVGLLASHLEGDVRRIESCLQTLFLKMQVLGTAASPDLALEVLSKFGCVEKPDSPLPTFEDFLCCVSQCYGLTESQICSCIRRRNFVEARNVLFYLARKHTRLTLAQIGARVNKRHSTVIKGIASVEHTLSSQTSAGRQTAHLVELIEKNAGCAQPGL